LPSFPCPFCKKEISEYDEICPFCQADLTRGGINTTSLNIQERETGRKELIVCPFCKYPAPSGISQCPHCRRPFPLDKSGPAQQKEPHSPEANDSNQTVGPVRSRRSQTGLSPVKEKKQKAFPVTSEYVVSAEPGDEARKGLVFPPACVTAGSFTLGPELVAGLRSVPQDKAPRAILSSADGKSVYHLIAGTSFYLGRQADVCHVPTILFPEQAYRNRNSNVSRLHSQIFFRGTHVFLKDLSRNGTFLFKRQIAYNQTVRLAHHDEVWISDVLGLQVSIYNDGIELFGVVLDRLENQSGEHYVLMVGPMPIGNNPALPLVLTVGPSLLGAIYYNTRGLCWCLRFPSAGERRQSDRVLDVVDEIKVGADRFTFYVL